MDRKENWYSVIQYSPDVVRGEKINVGVMLHDPEEGFLQYRLLEHTNIKIKSISLNDVLIETYKIQKDYIDYFLEKLKQSPVLEGPNLFNKGFFEDFLNILPEEFSLSEQTYCKPTNKDNFFEALLTNYIGKEYLLSNDEERIINVKSYMKNIFNHKNLLNTKIKQNARIKPIKELDSLHYTVDFVYKNGIYNFMHAVPQNSERINEWYAKLTTLLNADSGKSGFYIFYDDQSEYHKPVKDVLRFLKNDERINSIRISSEEFDSFCEKISLEGKNIEEFDLDLYAV